MPQSQADKEKIKLTAGFCSNLAVAIASLGVIGPFFTNLLEGLSSGDIWGYILVVFAIASACHLAGRWYLNDIEG